MEKLNTIQKRNKLNDVYRADAPGAGGASHNYLIVKEGAKPSDLCAPRRAVCTACWIPICWRSCATA